MKTINYLIIGALGLSIIGCADVSQAKKNSTMVEQDYQKPVNYNEKLTALIKSRLKDPYSAQINLYSGPKYASYKPAFSNYYGYGICYSVNAKNSYGGYTGEKLYMYLMDGDKIVWQNAQTNEVTIDNNRVYNFCNSLK